MFMHYIDLVLELEIFNTFNLEWSPSCWPVCAVDTVLLMFLCSFFFFNDGIKMGSIGSSFSNSTLRLDISDAKNVSVSTRSKDFNEAQVESALILFRSFLISAIGLIC